MADQAALPMNLGASTKDVVTGGDRIGSEGCSLMPHLLNLRYFFINHYHITNPAGWTLGSRGERACMCICDDCGESSVLWAQSSQLYEVHLPSHEICTIVQPRDLRAFSSEGITMIGDFGRRLSGPVGHISMASLIKAPPPSHALQVTRNTICQFPPHR